MADPIDKPETDSLGWLLDDSTPAVRHLALRRLLGRSADDPDVRAAREAAMRTDPIAAILAAQNPAGWWGRPGSGYGPKYTGTVWQLIFLDQLGADGEDPGCGPAASTSSATPRRSTAASAPSHPEMPDQRHRRSFTA